MKPFKSSKFSHVTDNWELTVKLFTVKWRKDNAKATSSFRYILRLLKKVVKNSPGMGVDIIQELVNKGKSHVTF